MAAIAEAAQPSRRGRTVSRLPAPHAGKSRSDSLSLRRRGANQLLRCLVCQAAIRSVRDAMLSQCPASLNAE